MTNINPRNPTREKNSTAGSLPGRQSHGSSHRVEPAFQFSFDLEAVPSPNFRRMKVELERDDVDRSDDDEDVEIDEVVERGPPETNRYSRVSTDTDMAFPFSHILP
jgi:hypothetical protein